MLIYLVKVSRKFSYFSEYFSIFQNSSVTPHTTSLLQPNGTFAEYIDVYSPLLKHQTPGCPYCNHSSGEDGENAKDFQEFQDFEDF
jgi:hypothetical protein